MLKIIFDTNVFENNKFISFPKSKIYISAIVQMELMTACNDNKELKSYQKLWNIAEKLNLLITPLSQDVFDASRIQFLLSQERKQIAGGKSPKRTSKIKQEIAMDCLIATSSCRENVSIATNDGDYWEIQRYLKKLKLIKL